MMTHDGYYRQVDGLAMGSPPAPMVANGWMSKFDRPIKGEATLYARYMDDIIRNINRDIIEMKLNEINDFHPSLKFTIEREKDQSLPFLDMKLLRSDKKLSSTWYTKPTDTGLTMNYHALAPRKYKRSVVSGLIHRIYSACSSWENFHTSLEKAKKLLESNQYPPHFYDPIIKSTINKLTKPKTIVIEDDEEEIPVTEKMVFVQYRGRVSDKFEDSLKRINAPSKIIFTIRKLKSVLPSLKPKVDEPLKSRVVYHIVCLSCEACYVGQTSRHLITRIKEHASSKPVGAHFDGCNIKLSMENVSILTTAKTITQLLILEH